LIEAKKKYFNGESFTAAQMKAVLQNTAIDMDTPGFDENTGAGFIQADDALQSFANPFPQVDSMHLQDSSYAPGTDPITVVVNGSYFANNASVIFQYDTIPATVIANGTQLTVNIPPFMGNPPLTVYNPPITPNGLDGGVSDSLYFFGTIPKNVKITVNDATKHFGEVIPAYSATVTVNNQSLAQAGLTLSDLGLTDITYSSSATTLSNIGLYYRRAASAVTDLSNQHSA